MPKKLEFVAVGHVTIDRIDDEERIGGAAAFAAVTASRMGLGTGLVTSAAHDYPFRNQLGGIDVWGLDAECTTVFENRYRADGAREQTISALSAPISLETLAPVRDRLSDDAAVLYCPIANELELPLVRLAPNGLCAVAAQGFFRTWNERGAVSETEWLGAESALEGVDVVSISEEDTRAPEELAARFSGRAFAITQGERGADLYSRGKVIHVPALRAGAVDPTGAGDVFAAALVVALRDGKDVPEAAIVASAAAAFAIEGAGIDAVASREAVYERARPFLGRKSEAAS